MPFFLHLADDATLSLARDPLGRLSLALSSKTHSAAARLTEAEAAQLARALSGRGLDEEEPHA